MTSGENFRNDQARTEQQARNNDYHARNEHQSHFYMWQAPGTVLSIYLSIQVVEELTAEFIRSHAGGLPGTSMGFCSAAL